MFPTRRGLRPTRVKLGDRGAVDTQGVAAVQLKRTFGRGVINAFVRRENFVGVRLHGSGEQHLRQLGQVGTAKHAMEAVFQVQSEVLHQVQAHQRLVGRGDGVTHARIRHRIGGSISGDDIEIAVDRDAQLEIVDGVAGGPDARRQLDVARLDVANAGIEIPQTIFARVSSDFNGARVPERARCGR